MVMAADCWHSHGTAHTPHLEPADAQGQEDGNPPSFRKWCCLHHILGSPRRPSSDQRIEAGSERRASGPDLVGHLGHGGVFHR